MAIFNKNNKKPNATYFDGYGKTEPLPLAQTQPIPGNGGPVYGYDPVPPTTPSNNGGLVTIGPDEPTPGNNAGGIESYGKTVGIGTVVNTEGRTIMPVVGWIVCVAGPNKGQAFELHSGYNYIGREVGNIVIPNDDMISREKNMAISYNPRNRAFGITRESASNPIYVNDVMLEGRADLNDYDTIETGRSTFVFVGFCGANFAWENNNG